MTSEDIHRKLEFISGKLAYLGVCALFVMMLLTTVDVIGRYIFNRPVLGAFEITEFLVLILIFSFLAHTQSHKTHVSVDLVFTYLPRRMRFVIDILNHVLCLVLMVLIVWMSFNRAIELREYSEASTNLGIPKFPFAYFVVLGCAVLCIEYIRDLISLLWVRRKGGDS